MPYITMCSDQKCPLKLLCYRFTAKPSEYQSYFSYSPYMTDTDDCEFFWQNENLNLKSNNNKSTKSKGGKKHE